MTLLQGRLNLVVHVRDAFYLTGSLRRSDVYLGKVASLLEPRFMKFRISYK